MLVLDRKNDERVRLLLPDGAAVWVSTFGIAEGRVKLGIDAPKDVLIDREERLAKAPAAG